MTERAIHMLRAAPADAMVRETFCFRTSYGGGTGRQVLTFAGDRGWFDATELARVVTCKRCLNCMTPTEGQDTPLPDLY